MDSGLQRECEFEVEADFALLHSIIIPSVINLIQFKGTGHDFCWSENPIYHLQKQGNILYISKQITKPL